MSSTTELIKSRLNIVDVIGGYIKLQKAGANFKAPCPFHSEKTPSFFVSPPRESWHCFGCNKGGDMFSFVMEIEGVEFPDALKLLAQKAGVEIEAGNKEYDSERAKLLNLVNDAKIFYQNQLAKELEVVTYLKNRGLTIETIKEFEIGFALDGWRNLYNFLIGRKYPISILEKTGMAIKKEAAPGQSISYYDRFRNRIMFPVKNSSGQTIGFSGRIFKEKPGEMGGKYINNPQTALYDKSRVLFGLEKAKTEIRKNDLCVLVEGQMDVIMSHQSGVKNTVAVSGTALTQEHLNIIKRLTENLAIAFDKDEAGQRASKRGIDMATAAGFEVRVIEIPSGKDPADTIKENPDTWRGAVKNAKHILDFYLDLTNDSQKIKENILPHIKLIPDEVKRSAGVKKVSERYGIKEEAILAELEKVRVDMPEPESAPAENLYVEHKDRLGFLRDFLRGFIYWQKDTTEPELKEEIEKYKKRLIMEGDEKEIRRQIFEAEKHYEKSESLVKEFKNLAREFEREEIKSQLEEITNQIYKIELMGDYQGAADKEQKFNELLNKFSDLTKKLNEIK